jgi:7-cyano-7-deazaguanine synthase
MQKIIYNKNKAVILFSGGQDSTTCLYWAKENFDEIYAIGFKYGQKHINEIEAAKKICQKENINYKIFDIENLLNANNDSELRLTEGRNSLFITIAGIYAKSLDIRDLITGTCQMDFNDYPDCRRKFIDSIQLTLSLGMDVDFRIHTPLMYLTKAETWKMAKDLNILDIIIHKTRTDYNGSNVFNEWGYGENNNHATQLRVDGYYEAKENGWI